MANEKRVLANFLGGEVLENPLLAAATTMTNPAFVAFPAIGTTEHMPLTFDPDGIEGAPFIKNITAHTALSDTVTITAVAQENTTERAVSQGIPFAHAATTKDLNSSGLIGFTYYNPNETGGGGSTLYTTTSTTFIDLDAANLFVSFIVPPSGKVAVRLTAAAYISTAGFAHYWGIREGTTILSPQINAAQGTNVDTKSGLLVVPNLSPGATKTWKWAYRVSGAATAGMRVGGSQVNDAAGAAVMEVMAVSV